MDRQDILKLHPDCMPHAASAPTTHVYKVNRNGLKHVCYLKIVSWRAGENACSVTKKNWN